MQVNRVKIGLGPVPRGPKATNKRKLCAKQGCLKQARDGSSHCISHGGGRRCEVPSCTKSAVGSSNRCKAHGGGRRCTVDGCGLVGEVGLGWPPTPKVWLMGGGWFTRLVNELTLAAEDGKGSMNIWRVDKAEEEIVLNSLGDGFVLLDIPLQKKALSYLTPTIHCKKLFDAVMPTPPRNYKKGVEGFLQFLRDTHDERLRKIHAWNEKFDSIGIH
ncbi:hypothetical protein FOL46_005942 [Perkinsus olseni]|uniref:WRKY19-like zinc finger domain-containing protein n=1 Tax=Perkinsus olseni TaxID=32597 RepID=A0A7J6LP73_PEROL|nr:hypothetical protein FOL46_005942 [Perkinsus olseni]